VEAETKTPIPAAIAYLLSWDSPRPAGMTVKTQFLFETSPEPASPPG
jgi:hypothetical protein